MIEAPQRHSVGLADSPGRLVIAALILWCCVFSLVRHRKQAR
jgi:hypothetical protein